jgi:hypothetical protein
LCQGQCDIPGENAKIRVPTIISYADYKGSQCTENHDSYTIKTLRQEMDELHVRVLGKIKGILAWIIQKRVGFPDGIDRP